MHHAGKREDEEEGHAHEDVHLEEEVDVFQIRGRAAAEGNDVLRPLHQLHHFLAVEVHHADEDGGQPQQQRYQQPHQHQLVAPCAVDADALDFEAAADEDNQAGQRGRTENAARRHGGNLLGLMADADKFPKPQRGQQAEQVAEKHGQHADMEQYAAQAQLPAVKQLAGVAFPCVLLAVEAHQAAEEKDGKADVGVDAEEKLIKGIHVAVPLFNAGLWGKTARSAPTV